MRQQIRLAIIGCGGMGHRHLSGLAELHRAGYDQLQIVAACDPVADNANSLADQAKEYFGNRPVVVNDLSQLVDLDIQAVDVTATPKYHHTIIQETLRNGWHTMVEKPMGLTVRACNLMKKAVNDTGLILSVAENYRRDPINRLAKALLEANVIGIPRFLIHHTVGGADQMLISVWRHKKNESGVLLDVGVHYADMMEYLLGEIESVYAKIRLHEPIRQNRRAGASDPAGVYGKWQKEMPTEFEATAEDAAYATLQFKSGAVGQYIEDHAGRGDGLWARQIHGSLGSITLPGDRSGRPIQLNLHGQGKIEVDHVLELVPDFRLDPITASLFGNDRLSSYQFPFDETDRKLLAFEYGEFAQAITNNSSVEVDVDQGTRSVAISYAMMESSTLNRAVTVDEVIAEDADIYQSEINRDLQI